MRHAHRLQSVALLAALVLLAASCSNMNQLKRAEEETETLRTLSEALSQRVPWTDELENGRLTADVSTTNGIEQRVALSPMSVLAGGSEGSVEPRYPALDGFGSLDLSQLPQAIRTQLDGFCAAITSDERADDYMAQGSLYSLALFYYDVAERLAPQKRAEQEAEARAAKQRMAEEARTTQQPAKKKRRKAKTTTSTAATEAAPTSAADANAETATASDDTAAKTKPDFNSTLYGEPFVAADFVQVPVRFSGRFATVDVALFFSREDDAWKIDQIRIRKWETAHGT